MFSPKDLVGLALQDVGNLKEPSFTIYGSTFAYGDLIANILDFLIIAVLVFVLYKAALQVQAGRRQDEKLTLVLLVK